MSDILALIDNLRVDSDLGLDAIRAEIEQVLENHDRRVAELLEANNREVERRRSVESVVKAADAFIDACGGPSALQDKWKLPLEAYRRLESELASHGFATASRGWRAP